MLWQSFYLCVTEGNAQGSGAPRDVHPSRIGASLVSSLVNLFCFVLLASSMFFSFWRCYRVFRLFVSAIVPLLSWMASARGSLVSLMLGSYCRFLD